MARSLIANGHMLENFFVREDVHGTLPDFREELSNAVVEQELGICRPSVEFEQVWIIELSEQKELLGCVVHFVAAIKQIETKTMPREPPLFPSHVCNRACNGKGSERDIHVE